MNKQQKWTSIPAQYCLASSSTSLLAVTQGVAFLLTHITDFTFTQGLLISWVSYTAFTMYSGTRGVILTDTLMFLLFTSVAMLVVVLPTAWIAWRMIRKSYG